MGNETIIGINTILLYVLAAAFLALLVYLMVRTQMRNNKLLKKGKKGESDSENGRAPREDRMTDSEREEALDEMLKKHPCLSAALVWLNEQLLRSRRAKTVTVTLEQEWCCEDTRGDALLPTRSRPSRLVLSADGTTSEMRIEGYAADEYLTRNEGELMGWCMLKQCRMLIPFRRYSLRVKRVTRKFFVENNAPVKWKRKSITMEIYTAEVL